MSKLFNDTPFGWKKRKDTLITNDLEQWVIKRILDEQLGGKSLEEISQDLKKIGIKPKNGGEWFPRRIKNILSENEQLSKMLIIQSVISTEAKPVEKGTEDQKYNRLFLKEPAVKPLRANAITYEIKQSIQEIEKCKQKASQRSLEVGKIITYALLSAVMGKHHEKQLMKGDRNELQDRNICKSEH